MTSPGYVWEQLYKAMSCLCDEGDFNKRLEDATISALAKLNKSDLDGDQGKDLKFILDLSKENIEEGKIKCELKEGDRKALIEKVISLLLDLHQDQI